MLVAGFPLSSLNVCSRSGHHPAGCLPSKLSLRLVTACSQGGKSSGGSSDEDLPKIPLSLSEGNDQVQEALADILQMSIRKQEVKQQILDDLEIKKEKLRLIGDEVSTTGRRSLTIMPQLFCTLLNMALEMLMCICRNCS